MVVPALPKGVDKEGEELPRRYAKDKGYQEGKEEAKEKENLIC